MTDAAKNPSVIAVCLIPDRLEKLRKLYFSFENLQRSLNGYLDSKRHVFPRFYFISTDELLSILGASDPFCVRDEIHKMFDNVNALQMEKLEDGSVIVTGMISAEGEIMKFRNNGKRLIDTREKERDECLYVVTI